MRKRRGLWFIFWLAGVAAALPIIYCAFAQEKAEATPQEHGEKVVAFAEKGPFKAAYPENARFINGIGRLYCLYEDLGVYKEHRWAFKPRAEERYYVVLENSNLEELEKLSQEGRQEVRISGTFTLYRGVNYLLVTRVSPK
jgi:hypothetical protein